MAPTSRSDERHDLALFEITSSDSERTQAFYQDLFDWSYDRENVFGYPVIHTGTPDVIGGIGTKSSGYGLTLYFYVDNLHTALDRAMAFGGTVAAPVTEIEGIRLARFVDPCANTIGLWKWPDQRRSTNPPQPREQRDFRNRVVGFDLACFDQFRAAAFYRQVFSWKVELDTGTISPLRTDLPGRIREAPEIGATLIVEVDDIDEAGQRTEQLGGKIITSEMAPSVNWLDGRPMVRCTDVAGNAFAVVASGAKRDR